MVIDNPMQPMRYNIFAKAFTSRDRVGQQQTTQGEECLLAGGLVGRGVMSTACLEAVTPN
jgi:hypothetical protein